MKFFKIILTLLLIILSACDGSDYVTFQLNKKTFALSGQSNGRIDPSTNLQYQKLILPGYDNSYLEIKPDETTGIIYFNLVISFLDYQKNKVESESWNLNNLPGDRNILPQYSGGSGVGNGFLPTQETSWDYGLIRIYQQNNKFGIFISMQMNMGQSGFVMVNRQKSKEHIIFVSFVSKTSAETKDDGVLILMEKVIQPKAQDVLRN